MRAYASISAAFLGELREILTSGEIIDVRGSRTRELVPRALEISESRERYLAVAGRNNNVFAQIAESMWVIAGRNDLEYLAPYLPRAPEFSDDGTTWRGGYGPRLRDWNGIDQVEQILRLLLEEPGSRRAVIGIYDPDRDFVESRDVPCNNWLHFMVRDDKVELHAVARSTDIWWGFSGINIFEWSLLLEMVAYWLGREPGRLVFFTSSMHLYERHFTRGSRVVQAATLGASRKHDHPKFGTQWTDLPRVLSEWMRVEREIRAGADFAACGSRISDPLLESYARMIGLYWEWRRGAALDDLDRGIAALGWPVLQNAAREYFTRAAREVRD